jgi:L-asparaginase
MEYRVQEQSIPRLKPRLIIHGGAGNIQRDTYPPEQFRAYRKALIDIVSSYIVARQAPYSQVSNYYFRSLKRTST